jgi:hypothetical protein
MLEVSAFTEEHLDAAADLLAKRHRRHREVEPLLPGKPDFRTGIAALLEKAGASGVVAQRHGRTAAYLVGSPRDEETWGKSVWIELAGHAAEEPEDVRDLYAAAAAGWVDEGRARHSVLVPASDRALVDAWFRLGFGQQQAHGVREVPEETPVLVSDGFKISEPDPAVLEELIATFLRLHRSIP